MHHAPRVYTVRGAGEAKQRVVKLVWPDRDGGCNEADVLEALQRHPHARAVPLLSRTDVMVGGHRAIALSMPLVPHDIGHGLGASEAGTVKAVIQRLLDITRVRHGGRGPRITGSVHTFCTLHSSCGPHLVQHLHCFRPSKGGTRRGFSIETSNAATWLLTPMATWWCWTRGWR